MEPEASTPLAGLTEWGSIWERMEKKVKRENGRKRKSRHSNPILLPAPLITNHVVLKNTVIIIFAAAS